MISTPTTRISRPASAFGNSSAHDSTWSDGCSASPESVPTIGCSTSGAVGAAQLASAFESVKCVRPAETAPVAVRDARIVADYVASVGDAYASQVSRPWSEVVVDVEAAAAAEIAASGAFVVTSEIGAFVCR